MNDSNETLRWPANLDHAAIVHRLVLIRDSARACGFPELAARLTNVEGMTAAQLGTCVIAALTLVQERPQHRPIATQLETVAMNLKNLR